MRILLFHRAFVFCLLAIISMSRALAHDHGPAAEMASAARHWLASLTPEQQATASFDLKSEERFNWHYIPRARKGLSLKDMTSAQRHLAHALLSSGLSHAGYAKATGIMSLEQILNDIEQGKGPKRDPELYFVSIFGKPGAHEPWAWRFEGHHLAFNFTIPDGQHVAVTPSFLGTNPGEVREGPRKGLRVLAHEEDLARALVRSLNDDQRHAAIYTNTAPADIITVANRKAQLLKPDGLAANKLNKEQSELLWHLVREYVYRHRAELAEGDLKKIQAAGLDKIFFAWAGSTEPGKGHYYRIQGPTFLMEYDNTQNNANHIHAVWRDLNNDFGEDLLKKHYQEHHSKSAK